MVGIGSKGGIVQAKLENFETVQRELTWLPKKLFPKVKEAFRRFAFNLQKRMVDAASGQRLKRRSGELARGFIPKVGGNSLKTIFAQVSNSVRYVAVHEFGGIIKPVKAKWLTIPLPKNQTASGVTRKTARGLFTEGNAFIHKGVIFENRGKTKAGKDRKPVPMFALKKQVKIPARLGFMQAAEHFANRLIKDLREMIYREAS